MFNCLLLVMTTSIMLSFIGANLPVIWYTFFGLISWIDSPLSSKSESSVVELLSGKIGKTERFESCQHCPIWKLHGLFFFIYSLIMHVDDVIIFFLSERKLEDGGLGLRLFLLCYIGSLGYFCALV